MDESVHPALKREAGSRGALHKLFAMFHRPAAAPTEESAETQGPALAAEAALVEAQRRMQAIVESAMDGIVCLDERRRITLFNPAAERMFRVRAERALGKSFLSLAPEHLRTDLSRLLAGTSTPGVRVLQGVRLTGEVFPMEASISSTEIAGEKAVTLILRDITERVAGEETRTLLAREVDHRAKNALAVVQSIVSLTRADSKEAFAETVKGRISALARAHNLLSQSGWQGGSLLRLISSELTPYAKPSQLWLSGPAVTLASDAVQPLSLFIHELATNACKHGALQTETGLVEMEWAGLSDGSLRLGWRESGGPPVSRPESEGFGAKLLQQVVTRQLRGMISLSWRPEGLEVSVILPPGAFVIERSEAGSIEEASGAPVPALAGGGQRGRILVIEDEMLIGLEMAEELTGAGWTVVGPAGTFEQAIRLARETPDLTAALVDVNLHGRAAYPVADTLRERGVPFIFCTGYELLQQDARYERCAVLKKPVNASALHDELSRLLAA